MNHSGSERLSTEEIGDEMLIGPVDDWATHTFGKSDLGDKRRTERLIKVAGSLASHIGQSLVKSCATAAEIEGAYRLLRNDKVDSKAIAEGGFKTTAALAASSETLLALEDSPSLTCQHSACAKLGLVGHKSDSQRRGLMGQSVYLSNAVGDVMLRTIAVCDRESDIYDYLSYKISQRQRFIVRAATRRCGLVSPYGSSEKGGRKTRVASIDISYAPVTVSSSQPRQASAVSHGSPMPGRGIERCVRITRGFIDPGACDVVGTGSANRALLMNHLGRKKNALWPGKTVVRRWRNTGGKRPII